MRKKITKIIRQTNILPKQIITFDNQDFNSSILQPITHRNCNPLSFKKNSQILKVSAAQASTFCLAFNQIMGQQRIMAIYKAPIRDTVNQNSVKWICMDYNQPELYQIYTEPQILSGEKLVEQHEESISFPFLNFNIKRYQNITVQFKNQRNIKEIKQIQGYQAYAFQQGLQQLDGIIPFDWRVNHGKIYFQKEAAQYFPKASGIIEEYVKDLKKVFDEYPELIAKQEKIASQDNKQLHQEMLPFELDYFRRLVKHYGREMELLPEKLQAKQSGVMSRTWKDQDLKVKIIKK